MQEHGSVARSWAGARTLEELHPASRLPGTFAEAHRLWAAAFRPRGEVVVSRGEVVISRAHPGSSTARASSMASWVVRRMTQVEAALRLGMKGWCEDSGLEDVRLRLSWSMAASLSVAEESGRGL